MSRRGAVQQNTAPSYQEPYPRYLKLLVCSVLQQPRPPSLLQCSTLSLRLPAAAGCLPTLATIPVFWGLFRTLTNVAASGSLTEGFYFIPSLAGPTQRGETPDIQDSPWRSTLSLESAAAVPAANAGPSHPVTIAPRYPAASVDVDTRSCSAGGGITWLYPLVDGTPPIGWDEASRCANCAHGPWAPPKNRDITTPSSGSPSWSSGLFIAQ